MYVHRNTHTQPVSQRSTGFFERISSFHIRFKVFSFLLVQNLNRVISLWLVEQQISGKVEVSKSESYF